MDCSKTAYNSGHLQQTGDSSMSQAPPDTHTSSPTDFKCMVQTVKKTMLKARQSSTDPDLSLLCLRTTPIDNNHPPPNSYTPGSSDPTSLSYPPTHPKPQPLSTRICKPASGCRRSTMTRAPVTFHHSIPANMSTCRKPTGPGHQPLLSRRCPNRIHTPFAL